jgi:hypothetical protein
MDISGIISISGQPGLYKVLGKLKNGVIGESLIDKKRIPVYANVKVSALEDISIFSTKEDVPLKDVLQKIYDKEKGGPAPDGKADIEVLKKYLEGVFPEYDKERVYASDIKKIFSWYNMLLEQGFLKKKESKEENKEISEALENVTGKEKKAAPKVNLKDTSVKPLKTQAPKVKTQTVRKTGA